MSKWTIFHDMFSGGSQKEYWSEIYVEASESNAVEIFIDRFGHDPHNETCECCGSDYWIETTDEDPVDQKGVLVIRK